MANEERQSYDFGYKRIADYSADELDLAVSVAREHCRRKEIDFYAILRGVDAYMEKRRRKTEAAKEKTDV